MANAMLNSQRNFVEYLEQVNALVKEAGLDKSKDTLIKSIQERELLVPVVGGFSAGKSTAINAFLGEDILSVAITPETALATELRYAQGASYAEAVKENGQAERIELDKFSTLKDRASEFQFVRLYLNNPKLEQIKPLILVDMPGFDAPLEAHNKAIMEYLARGVYFVILDSVENGTIAMSIKKHIDSLMSLGREFSFCLSKGDLRSKDDIDTICQSIAQDLELEFGYEKPIHLLSKKDSKAFDKLIAEINAESLFEKLFKDDLKVDFIDTKSSLQTTISALQASKDEAQNAIKELEQGLKSIARTKNNLADNNPIDIQAAVAATLNAVDRALIADMSSLAKLVISNQQAFSSEVSEVVRSTLLNEFSKQSKEQIQTLVNAYKIELSGLNLSSFKIDASWLDNSLNALSSSLNKISINPQDNSVLVDTFGEALLKLTALLSKIVVLPWLKAFLSVLAPLVSPLMDLFRNKSIDENELKALILPKVRVELENQIANAYSEQIKALQEIIAISLENKFKEKQEEISKAQEEKEQIASDLEAKIQGLNQINTSLENLANQYLYAK